MFVEQRFELNDRHEDYLRSLIPCFGYDGFGEAVFYRTYSRIKSDGGQENWADCVIRVINGIFSIRKDWYVKTHIAWDEDFWQIYARRFGESMFKMQWLPPGRGLWAMGSNFMYERGSMCLYNCAATLITDNIGDDLSWAMDSLMCGVGVGFEVIRNDALKVYVPRGVEDFIIPDTREGWAACSKAIADSYLYPERKRVRPIYDLVRPAGLPIKGFGGMSSGPEPLKMFHDYLVEFFERFRETKEYDSVRLKADTMNACGKCVVAGNVRRSAEILKGKITDLTFMNLKDYNIYPDRGAYGWLSNNSVALETDEDFMSLGEIAKRVIKNGEPGYINMRNLPFGRIGKKMKGLRKDKAIMLNPCQPGWAKVLTPNGIRELKDICVGDVIWSETGWTGIEKKWSTGVKKVFKYTTRAGVFYGTENHRVVSDFFKVEVKDALSIDILKAQETKPDVHQPDMMMDGFLIGDGTVQGNVILANIGENDQDIHSHLCPQIGKSYNKDYQFKVQTSLSVEDLPVTYKRKIPEKYLMADSLSVRSFLRGLFSANGSVCGNRVTLKATSLRLIEEVQMMLSSVGIGSYYTVNKSKYTVFDNGTYACKQSYDLNIPEDRHIFYNTIGFIQKYKMKKLKDLMNDLHRGSYKRSYEIISVEFVSEEEVFDITVDNWTHTYWTQGLNVSNCGEIPLEHREVCNVDDTYPTVCCDPQVWLQACEYAAFYCSTVSLLPTHQPTTNQVVARNRRIGVSLVDYTGWIKAEGVHKVINWLRQGYDRVRETNKWANEEAGIPLAIRVTTVKPGGTAPKLPGRTPGIGYPNFEYMIRRMNVPINHPLNPVFREAGVPAERNVMDKNSDVFEFPVYSGDTKPSENATLWEQALNLVTVQREWADNAVSNTLNFRPMWPLVRHVEEKFVEELAPLIGTVEAHQIIDLTDTTEYVVPDRYKILITRGPDSVHYVDIYEFDERHEERDIEPVLSAIAPLTKSVAVLPHSAKGAYKQMPEEGISKEEFEERKDAISPIDYSNFSGSDGQDEVYCSGPICEIPRR